MNIFCGNRIDKRSLCVGICRFFPVLFLFWGVGQTTAQTTPQAADSLISYDLAEIVVSEEATFSAEANTVQRVSIAGITRKNASSVSDLARLIPAAHLQTNSRGESLIYLRNAGERQIALFFNGALLNVPWDNRMNLDLVPANVIGGMTVTKGVPSVLYGTNVLGGAISITSRTIDYEGAVTEIGAQYGEHATSNFSLTHILSKGAFKFTGAAGYSSRNGQSLPPVSLFSQNNSSIRSNTDRNVINLFGQGDYHFNNGARVGLSYLFIDGDFGIAPEGHLNPEESTVRYWRYPKFINSTVVLNASAPLGSTALIRGAFWGSWFDQDINSYDSDTYERLEEQQRDEDNTFGTRITLNQQVGIGQLSYALNVLKSRHSEIMLETLEDGSLSDGGAAADIYEQTVFSTGLEFTSPFISSLSDHLRLTLGASLDGIMTPETGDKPALDPQTGLGVSGGLQYLVAPGWILRASTGRKVRFPTMRELFGVALNRFLLNPDLKPESSFVNELALVKNGSLFSGEIIGFYQRTHDTIDQENVDVDGATLRRRINLDGSRVVGVELVGQAKPLQTLIVDGHLTVMKARGIDGGETFFLTEKPAVLGSWALIHNNPSGISLSGQVTYTGRAYGRNESNELVPLVKSAVFDFKAGYLFSLRNESVTSETFVRVDNLFDAETLPQLGLPGAGRLFSFGVNVSL